MSDKMDSARAILMDMERVAAAAEDRAKRFRGLADSLAQSLEGNGNRPPEEIADMMRNAGWVENVVSELDSVQHVHSGGSEAMYGRSLRSQLLRNMEDA